MGDDDSGSEKKPEKKAKSKVSTAISNAGRDLNQSSVESLREIARDDKVLSYKRGGTKRGDGAARLHKAERIMAPKRGKKRKMGRKGGR